MLKQTLPAAVILTLSIGATHAIEGSSTAGPIGGTDIRSALLPPPGLYGAAVGLWAEAFKGYDGSGNVIPALEDLHLQRARTAVSALYVPNTKVLDGAIGFLGVLPGGTECGRLFASTAARCITGLGDLYVEAAWSRFFGQVRPSTFTGAPPVPEGLGVQVGFGIVFPTGRYSAEDATLQGLTIGNNIWDFAPSIAITATSRPIIADGTELSAKLYYNTYLENRDTRYRTGDLLNLDFALTERFGRVQAGLTGIYVGQVEDDRQNGVRVAPDGRRVNVLQLGPIVSYDMPETAASIKVKALKSIIQDNNVGSYTIAVTLVWKLD